MSTNLMLKNYHNIDLINIIVCHTSTTHHYIDFIMKLFGTHHDKIFILSHERAYSMRGAQNIHVKSKQQLSYIDDTNNYFTRLPKWDQFNNYKNYPKSFDTIAIHWLLICKQINKHKNKHKNMVPKDIQYLILAYMAENWKLEKFKSNNNKRLIILDQLEDAKTNILVDTFIKDNLKRNNTTIVNIQNISDWRCQDQLHDWRYSGRNINNRKLNFYINEITFIEDVYGRYYTKEEDTTQLLRKVFNRFYDGNFDEFKTIYYQYTKEESSWCVLKRKWGTAKIKESYSTTDNKVVIY